MDNTSIIETITLWDQYTKKHKYCLFTKFDEHNNTFGKGWLLGSEFMNGKNISAFQMLKLNSQTIYSSYMIYLRLQQLSHQELLPLVALNNTVRITTCLMSSSPK